MSRASMLVVGGTALVLVLAAFLVAPAPAAALVNCDTTTDALDSAELEMLQLVNEARAAEGVTALGVSPNLNRAAAWKSEDEGSNGTYGFDHTDSLGRSPFVRAQDCGYPSGAGENIAYGFPSARATFDAFMNSPGHRANILNSGYVVIGIGRSGSAWALNFGFVDDSSQPAPPPAATATATPTPTQVTAQPTPTATAALPTATSVPPAPARPQATVTPAAATATPVRPTATAAPSTPVANGPAPRQVAGLALPAGTSLARYGGPALPIGEATRPLGAGLRSVYWWDAANGRWLRYFPGGPSYTNTLTQLEPGMQVYVSVSAAAAWTY